MSDTTANGPALTAPGAVSLLSKDALLALCIILVGSSLSPFALEKAGVFDNRVIYACLMPVLVLSVALARTKRIDPLIACVLGSQMVAILLAVLADGIYVESRLKTIGTLLSVGVVSVAFTSKLLDLRVFVKVAVLCTLAILFAAACSTVLAAVGYFEPVPLFDREDGQVVYKVGYALTNEISTIATGYFIRPGGVFIESGQLAMYASLALLINASILDNRKYEWLLICLGFFTSALSFYLFLPIFFLMFRRRAALAISGVLLLVVVLGIWGTEFADSGIAVRTMTGRITGFFGDSYGGNRYAATVDVLSHLDRLHVFGSVKGVVSDNENIDATVWGPLLGYGIAGGLAAYLHVAIFAAVPLLMRSRSALRGNVRTNMLAICTLLTVSLYHRPYTYHFLYYVYVIAMFEWEWRKYRSIPSAVVLPSSSNPVRVTRW